jgi:hypothetical protein
MTSLAAHESGTLRLRETRRPAGIPGDRIQGGPIPVIAVTRLRLRDPALLTELFTAGAAVLQQAKKADGNLGANALGDTKQRLLDTHRLARTRPHAAFMNSEPHLTTMGHLDDWCDEATSA